MDDRFLSRGKCKDNGEWVVGYCVCTNSGRYFIKARDNPRSFTAYDIFEIIPETLGGCTGLTDKNGKLMFEGDIVKAYLHNETKFTEKIEFRNGCFWFGNWNFIEFLDKFRNYEIIGNIHDNPDILNRADTPVPDDVSQPVLAPATPENFEIFPA